MRQRISGVQAGALLLAMLAAFPFNAGATDPTAMRAPVAETAPRAAEIVVAQVPVADPTPLPAQPAPSAIVQLPTAVPAPAAQKAPLPGPAQPSLVPPAPEKAPDRIMSPAEVERQVTAGLDDDPDVGEGDGFFDTASKEVEKGKDGSFARMTNPIDKFIDYFTNRGRKRMELYLARSGKYREMMRGILAKYGLPEDLIYLALIESGFSLKAYSHAKAAGPWQFIAGTGRRYGLRIDWWADERRDAEKSTHAAAGYLKDLYGMFDSWPLAAAAYNAGEGKISRAVNMYKSDDFSELIRHRYLAQETKDYVPKMLAALTIAKEPEKYGFSDIEYEEPLILETVTVPGGTDLVETARIIEVPYDDIREWNPELRRFCTPPNRDEYGLRLSAEAAVRAGERMEEIRTRAKVTFLQHDVRNRETLDGLAAKYDTSPAILRELNGLRQDSLRRVSRLVIPVTGLSGEEAVPGREIAPDRILMAHQRAEESRRRTRTAATSSGRSAAKESVRVRKGETLTSIAKKHGVSTAELARANGLSVKSKVKAGTRLAIPDGGSVETKVRKKTVRNSTSGRKTARPKVRQGTSADKIARARGVE